MGGEVRFCDNKYFAWWLAKKTAEEVREQWKNLGGQEPFQIFKKNDKNKMDDMLLQSLRSLASLEVQKQMESLNNEKKLIPMMPGLFYQDGYAFLDFLFKMLEMEPDAVETYFREGEDAFKSMLSESYKNDVEFCTFRESKFWKRKPHVFEIREALLVALKSEMQKMMQNHKEMRIRI